MDYCLGVFPREKWLCFDQLPQLENTQFKNCPDLPVKLHIRLNSLPLLGMAGLMC